MHRTVIRAVMAASLVGLALPPAAVAQAQAGAFPAHVQLTRDEDFARTRALLGLSGPPPAGADGANPETFNEATANPYPNLPDPLTLNSGQKVTTPAMWTGQRRAELLEIFQREIYGRRPTTTPKVTWEVLSTTREMNGDVPVITKQLVGRVDNSAYPALTVNILASVTTPASATGPVPVILSYSVAGFGWRGVEGPGPAPTTVCQPANAPPPLPPRPAPTPAARPAGAPPAAPQGPTSQQQALALGWGYASLNTGSVQADNGQGLTCGIIGLVNRGQPRGVDDWGALSAWGWGASRLLDYFETDPAVDARKVGIYGHSRWGKAALAAAVFDPRFAIAYDSSSGQGGAKLHRRRYGETVDNVASNFYYWMAGNYMKYAGRWDAMPVDNHEFIALMAPRPVFFSDGNGPATNPDGTIATRVNDQGRTVVANANDAWTDPRGTWVAAKAAGPVYELFGGRGLAATDFPPLDTEDITGDIGHRQHGGGHTSGTAWETFYKFAARQFAK